VTESTTESPVTGSRWKNPFVIAFLLGVVVLTVLPFLQRRFLKAPPAIAPLTTWSLSRVDDARPFGSADLVGHVFIIFFAASPCETGCLEAHRAFGRGIDHTDDLADMVHFVTVARETAAPALKGLATGRWHVVTGSDEALSPLVASLHAAWALRGGSDAGSTFQEQIALQAFAVIDQAGQVRDFWRADSSGRGNAINAARLLARYGTNP
jgi:cytochrome oxidase Cu insertion factor (SCO1/SenC/PrrC family)